MEKKTIAIEKKTRKRRLIFKKKGDTIKVYDKRTKEFLGLILYRVDWNCWTWLQENMTMIPTNWLQEVVDYMLKNQERGDVK